MHLDRYLPLTIGAFTVTLFSAAYYFLYIRLMDPCFFTSFFWYYGTSSIILTLLYLNYLNEKKIYFTYI